MEPFTITLGFIPSYRPFGERPIAEWPAWLREEAIAVVGKIPHVKLIFPLECSVDPTAMDAEKGYTPYGAVCNLDQVEIVTEYFARQKIDGLLIGALDFGDERSSAKIAEKLGVPVMLYATKEPPAVNDASLARVSDSYCGTLSIASALYRRKIPFYFGGLFFHDEPGFSQAIEVFIKAVSVVKGLKGARIGQVGVRPASFETVGYDETALIRKFKQNVVFVDLSEIVGQAQKLTDDDPQVIEIINQVRSEVKQFSIADEWFTKEAKLELVLERFAKRNLLSAMGMQCWPAIQQSYGISTCALFGRLTSKGILTACEVDIIGALSMLVQFRAALGMTVPHFIDWTIQHREKDNCFLAWHCGNAPVCLANNPDHTALRSRWDMMGLYQSNTKDTQAGLYQFQLKPGKVTFCRLQEYDDRWKMLITSGEIIPSQEILAGTWSWVEVADHQKLYRTLVEEGFVHHASMIHGDYTEALKLACKFLDIAPVVI